MDTSYQTLHSIQWNRGERSKDKLALNKIPECRANSESSTARTTRKYLEDNYKGN